MSTASHSNSLLAQLAAFQQARSSDRPGLHDEGTMWRIGSLSFWKSSALSRTERRGAPTAEDAFPSYLRGSLEMTLYPDMHVDIESFTGVDNVQAYALLLRSEKDLEGTFGTFFYDKREAHSVEALLNSEMDAARAVTLERFRANGGDAVAASAQRAPSTAEMFAILDKVLGAPNDE